MMRTVSVSLPDFVDIDVPELKFILASRLYGSRKLSLGQAAEVAGLSKRTFMELLGSYGVSVFNYDPTELEADLHHA